MRRGSRGCGVCEEEQTAVGREIHPLVGEFKIADNRMVDTFDTCSVFTDIVRRPQFAKNPVMTVSSTAGLVGVDFCSAYSASKFALEGWMETLHFDVEPFGITTTIVEPGFFRTELLVEGASTLWADLSIDDYSQRTEATIAAWRGMNGTQGGDPAKLGAVLITVAALEQPPLRWQAGADAVQTAESKAKTLLEQAEAHRGLSSSLSHDDVTL